MSWKQNPALRGSVARQTMTLASCTVRESGAGKKDDLGVPSSVHPVWAPTQGRMRILLQVYLWHVRAIIDHRTCLGSQPTWNVSRKIALTVCVNPTWTLTKLQVAYPSRQTVPTPGKSGNMILLRSLRRFSELSPRISQSRAICIYHLMTSWPRKRPEVLEIWFVKFEFSPHPPCRIITCISHLLPLRHSRYNHLTDLPATHSSSTWRMNLTAVELEISVKRSQCPLTVIESIPSRCMCQRESSFHRLG